MRYCSQCGTANVDEATVCANCGASLSPAPAPTPEAAVPPPGPTPPTAATAPAAPGAPAYTAPRGPDRQFEFTLPRSVRGTTLIVAGVFAFGLLFLLLLVFISALSDPAYGANAALREITLDLSALFWYGVALFGAYRLVTYGFDPAWLARVPVWGRWLIVLIVSVLLNSVISQVVVRLLGFLPAAYARDATGVHLMEFLEGLVVLAAFAAVYWRLAARKAA